VLLKPRCIYDTIKTGGAPNQ